MATTAKNARFKRELELIENFRKDRKSVQPRTLVRIRMRCRLCGRPRANYRKFGICRICFRNMASQGIIPGVKKASW